MLYSSLIEWGYFGYFLLYVASSTLLPIGTLPFVILAVKLKMNLYIILILGVTGKYIGSTSNYFIGKLGDKFFLSKYQKTDKKKLRKTRKLFNKYGAPTLLFSWIPIIGDFMSIVAGAMELNFKKYSILIIISKIIDVGVAIFIAKGFFKISGI